MQVRWNAGFGVNAPFHAEIAERNASALDALGLNDAKPHALKERASRNTYFRLKAGYPRLNTHAAAHSNLAWQIKFDPDALDQLAKLDKPVRRRIASYLEQRVAGSSNPRGAGHGLSGELAGLWRYRIGDYRAICQLKDEILTILVVQGRSPQQGLRFRSIFA